MKQIIGCFLLFSLVVVSVAGGVPATATGGTITTNENKIIHTFTTDGNFVVSDGGSLSCEILIVAGGGGGGTPNAGGGGAGGLIYTNAYTVTGTVAVVVGAGGGGVTGDGSGTNGVDSSFGTLTATGGGGGSVAEAGHNGGSGGGGGGDGNQAGGTGTAGQGYNGGNGAQVSGQNPGGGGGGANAVGANAVSGQAGEGGNGTYYAISGSYVRYCGGGGGGCQGSCASGAGGVGGGGGGGGGGGNPGGNGGSGIVIVSYLSHNIILGTTAQGFAWEGTGSDRAGRFYDKVDSYTKLLLHCDGADASTIFVDSAITPKTVTAYDNAQIDTANKQFGTGSALFDGTGDYLGIPNSADWDFGSGDFTIDFWIYPIDTTRQAIFASTSDYWLGLDYCCQGTRNINLFASATGTDWALINADSGGNGIGTISLVSETWTHVAFVRHGNSWRTYINGVIDVDITVSGTLTVKEETKNIGRWGGDGISKFNGQIDEFRISKGIARWTAAFTPPTRSYNE